MSGYDDIFNGLSEERAKDSTASPYDSVFSSVVRLSPEQEQKRELGKVDFGGQTFQLGFPPLTGSVNTGIPMPADLNRALSQFGSGVSTFGQAFAPKNEVDAKRRTDAPLNSEAGGKVVSTLGEISPTLGLPFGWLKAGGRFAPAVEGGIVGTGIGATRPVGTGESRAFNAGAGGVGGAFLPAAITAATRPSASVDPLIEIAKREGIPLGAADVSGSKVVKSARSILDDLFGGGTGQAKQDAFNAAIGRRMGLQDATKLTPEVVQGAKSARGAEMDAIWDRNNLNFTGDYWQKLQGLRAKAADLPQGERNVLERWIGEFERAAAVQADGSVAIPGSAAKVLQSSLRGEIDGSASGYLKTYLSDLRKSTIDAFNKSVTGEDAAKLTTARTQYKAVKTVEDLAKKSGVGTGGRQAGDIAPSLLPEAVRSSYGDLSSGAGKDFADLANMGSNLLVDRVPQTGGSMRALLQNGGLLGGSASGAYIAGGFPALIGAAPYIGGGLAGLKAAQMGLNSPAALRLLNSQQRFRVIAPSLYGAGLGAAPAALE